MSAKSSVSPSKFVVSIPHSPEARERRKQLDSLGTVEPIPGYPDRFLLHLSNPTDDPKTNWQIVRDALAEGVSVEPVFIDQSASPRYATGTVTVRFENAPSESELRRLESACGVRVKTRNKYVPSQVTFQPAEPTSQFLPEIIDEIERSVPEAKSVWADTVSQYHRN
jgi:hypothetical protein